MAEAEMSATTIAELLAAADAGLPASRPLGGLIERLTAAGLLRGARDGGRPIGPAALAAVEVKGITEDS